jgi:hypothetical protein
MVQGLDAEGPLGLVEDDMADLARARDALDAAWQRLRNLCHRPLTLDDIDAYSKAFREIEAGLNTVEHYLQEERARI